MIEARRETVEKRPDLVQRFVDASAIGWYNYLYGDNKVANEFIRKHNPEMSQELIDYSIAKMKEYGIVDSGDTHKDGIGAMTDAHMASFFDKMVKAGVVKPTVDFRKSYTLQFVNKGVGLELRPKVTRFVVPGRRARAEPGTHNHETGDLALPGATQNCSWLCIRVSLRSPGMTGTSTEPRTSPPHPTPPSHPRLRSGCDAT